MTAPLWHRFVQALCKLEDGQRLYDNDIYLRRIADSVRAAEYNGANEAQAMEVLVHGLIILCQDRQRLFNVILEYEMNRLHPQVILPKEAKP